MIISDKDIENLSTIQQNIRAARRIDPEAELKERTLYWKIMYTI